MITGRLSLPCLFGVLHRIEPDTSHAGGQWFKSTTAHFPSQIDTLNGQTLVLTLDTPFLSANRD
jgi:hypothetical protein